jgi:hypothetical protein
MPPSALLVDDLFDLSVLPTLPSLVLSASVPVARNSDDFDAADRPLVDLFNARYVDTARPDRIRAAVSALASVALQRKFRLLFGAHPTISPMILQVAHALQSPPGSILIFQSAAYLGVIPDITFKLTHRPSGQLILTADKDRQVPPPAVPPSRWQQQQAPYPHSIDFMRKTMMSVPGIRGAAFIGGMPGVEIEARMFRSEHPLRPRYALPTAGGAAALLDTQSPDDFHGTIPDRDALRKAVSYTVAASLIFDDIELRHP